MGVKWLASISAIAFLFVTATTALAQETKKPEAPPPMVPAKSGPEHALLAKDVGEWKVVTKSMMDPSKPAEMMEGTEKCSLIINGLFLRSDLHMRDPKGDFMGASVLGYDHKKQKYTGIWVDNYDTALYPYEGTCDANGKCVFTMDVKDPEGKAMTITMTWAHVDDKHRTFTMQMPGPDGKLFICMESEYTRM